MKLPTIQEREERYIRRVLALMGGSVGMTETQQKKLSDRRLQKRLEYLGRPARTM